MGGNGPPPIGGGQGSDGGGLAGKSRQNLEGAQISEECEKRGVKCLFYPLFGQKLAEFVLFLTTIIYI